MGSRLNSRDAVLILFPFAFGKGKARVLWTGDAVLGDFSFELHGESGGGGRCLPSRTPPSPCALRRCPASGPAEAVPGKGVAEQEKLPKGPSSSLRG